MRHRKRTMILDRKKAGRTALLRNLAGDLVLKEKIVTTSAKAKALRPFVERLITIAKKQNLNSRRLLKAKLPDNQSDMKLYGDLAKRYETRSGGYTRIVKMPCRPGDGAEMAVIEFV